MKTKLIIAVFAMLLNSCASGPSTNVSSSWKSSSGNTTLQSMNKILVVAVSNNDVQRRSIEDAFVQNLQGKAIASYSYFTTPISQINKETVSAQLSSAGFNGAMIIQLANQQTTGYSRPTSVGISPQVYWGFGSNLSAGIGVNVNLGSNNRKDIYTITTSFYRFPKDDLLWSGVVTASNPKDINSMAQSISTNVISKMKTDGVY